ncbi:hypothetical protein ABB27_15455 [Stenotrophomonas terrae]|uniref:Uncharacterized protein n=1 Tax=Stenotrophomonas terrae TaxID=405446 RepID=A0A0R0C7I1_9GAMM|nr:hypothetical protein ABB27_15455 [Stenotrophomonas terrae]
MRRPMRGLVCQLRRCGRGPGKSKAGARARARAKAKAKTKTRAEAEAEAEAKTRGALTPTPLPQAGEGLTAADRGVLLPSPACGRRADSFRSQAVAPFSRLREKVPQRGG